MEVTKRERERERTINHLWISVSAQSAAFLRMRRSFMLHTKSARRTLARPVTLDGQQDKWWTLTLAKFEESAVGFKFLNVLYEQEPQIDNTMKSPKIEEIWCFASPKNYQTSYNWNVSSLTFCCFYPFQGFCGFIVLLSRTLLAFIPLFSISCHLTTRPHNMCSKSSRWGLLIT